MLSLSISPAFGFINPEKISINVDLPDPLSPNIPILSPLKILKFKSSKLV